MSEITYPDAVMTPDKTTTVNQPWQALNPCPMCDAVPHDAPDGCHANGDPRWNFPHCWRCGFRPGTNEAMSNQELRRQFDAFSRMMEERQSQPALAPVDTGSVNTGQDTGSVNTGQVE